MINVQTYLLFFPQCKKTDTRNFDDLEADTRDITLGLSATTETRDEDFIVLVDEVQATIILRVKYQCLVVRLEGPRAPESGLSHQEGHTEMPRTGTNAVTFLPFLMSWTRTHFRMAELGCLASTPTFSRTMPFACEEPPVGEVL